METERLVILRDAEMIDNEAFEKTEKIIEVISKEFSLDLGSEIGQMFITHVSMAIMRIKNGDITSTVENVIFEEIKESENFENAQKFADIIADIIEHEIPKNEKEYLIINGCLLMEG
ncbi:MAG: PRD domain-containing protein [Sebaldella sp.]|nr:PRD domain-containing protein [Sebaldella sp.]